MERYLKGNQGVTVYIHDYTVDIGLPEHLEEISHQLKSEGAQTGTFKAFLKTLKRVIELGGDNLVELGTNAPFQADMDRLGKLTVRTDGMTSIVERMDLWGVWLNLRSGLVTEAQAGWSMSSGGNALLSMLSVLPQARAIQIEEPYKAAEFAVELLPGATRTSPVPESCTQTQFQWA